VLRYALLLIFCAILFAQALSTEKKESRSEDPVVKRIEFRLMRNGIVESFSFKRLEDRTIVQQFRFGVLFDEGSISNRHINVDDLGNVNNVLLDGLVNIATGHNVSSELTKIDINKSILITLDVFYDTGKQSQLVMRETEDSLSKKIMGDNKLKLVFERLLVAQHPKTKVSSFDGLVARVWVEPDL